MAGTCAAVALACGGVRVTQWAGPERSCLRPPEVLSPGARVALSNIGFHEPTDGGAPCEGVLSEWARSDADYHDYRLFAGMPALTVPRAVLLEALSAFAVRNGVDRRPERWRASAPVGPARSSVAQITAGADDVPSGTPLVLLAGGRVAARGDRLRLDGTIALCVPFSFRRYADRLLVEACEWGWWYAVPAGGGAGSLCFLTDADLLPPGIGARRSWLERLFAEARLIRHAANVRPDFTAPSGVDAHSGRAGCLVWDGGARIGEAALSLDPLSGTGVVRASEGGLTAAAEILETGGVGQGYVDFMARLAKREEGLRRAAFARAGSRFPGAPFWSRRT